VKKYSGTRYYSDGTFAITSIDRPIGIAKKFRGGAWGRSSEVQGGYVGVYIRIILSMLL